MSNINRRCRSPILTNEVPLKKYGNKKKKKEKIRLGDAYTSHRQIKIIMIITIENKMKYMK